MLKGWLKKFKQLLSRAGRNRVPPEKPSPKKGATWEKVAKKYKALPYFRVENYETHKELWFYQKTANEPNLTKYKFPLKLVQILFIAKFFPDDSEFFKKELVEAFERMPKYRRRV